MRTKPAFTNKIHPVFIGPEMRLIFPSQDCAIPLPCLDSYLKVMGDSPGATLKRVETLLKRPDVLVGFFDPKGARKGRKSHAEILAPMVKSLHIMIGYWSPDEADAMKPALSYQQSLAQPGDAK